MLKPLQDRVLVLMDESLPNAAGIHLQPDVSKWRAKYGAVEGWNRGTIVAVGPGKKHPKTGALMAPQVEIGEVVRFSELEYPEELENGKRYVLISEQDILMVEEPETA